MQGRAPVSASGHRAPVTAPRCAVALLAALLAGLALATTPARAASDDVLVVGDSLAVGTRPFLSGLLSDLPVTSDVRNGITTPYGMRRIRMALRGSMPGTAVISLGSNDGPSARRFSSRLRRTLKLFARDTCVVWPTIIRPRRKGAYRGINRVLHRTKKRDRRLVVVDWEHAVKAGAATLRDGLHATRDGYLLRGEMIAEAVRTGCPARVRG